MHIEKPDAGGTTSNEMFADFVAQHRNRLYHFILGNIGHPHDAEDLMQQTFVEAYRALSSFRGESALSTWLLGIAMNLVRNYLSRSPHRRYQFADVDDIADKPSDDLSPAEAIGFNQALAALDVELRKLPRELHQVLWLVAVDGIAYEEAAEMLGIPVGTVRSRLSRARATLRQRLPHVAAMLQED